TLAAQFRAKSRTVSQIPANSLPLNFKAPPAFVLPDSVPRNLQKKRTRTTPAQSCVPQSCLVRSRALQIRTVQLFTARTKFLNRKSLYPSLRPPLPRKPSRPHLHSLPQRIAGASASPQIHQQIPEPPSPAPIAQSKPQKPNLIPPPHRQLTEPLVERLHMSGRIALDHVAHFWHWAHCRSSAALRHCSLSSIERGTHKRRRGIRIALKKRMGCDQVLSHPILIPLRRGL